MELNYAIAFLTSYNRWRRGDVSLNMPDPREIGIALDTVLAAVTEGGTGNSGVERPEPSPHFLQKGDSPETDALAHSGLCPVSYIARMTDLARKLERERDEARQQEQIHYDNLHEARSLAQAGYAKAERAEKMLRAAAAKADQWRECAEGLILYAREAREALNKAAADKWVLELQRLNADIARYERLKEGGK